MAERFLLFGVMSRTCKPLRSGLGMLCQSSRAGSSNFIVALASWSGRSEAKNAWAASVIAAPTPAVDVSVAWTETNTIEQ